MQKNRKARANDVYLSCNDFTEVGKARANSKFWSKTTNLAEVGILEHFMEKLCKYLRLLLF